MGCAKRRDGISSAPSGQMYIVIGPGLTYRLMFPRSLIPMPYQIGFKFPKIPTAKKQTEKHMADGC